VEAADREGDRSMAARLDRRGQDRYLIPSKQIGFREHHAKGCLCIAYI
jgi:hypothetical protein